jgi:pimeloyl-ACP methyl ester carboxylesterase
MSDLKQFLSNGEVLHYEQRGTGDPLLFIPGSISDYRTWSQVYKNFETRFSCHLISRRFQYPSKFKKGGNSSVEVNTQDIASFIREKELAPVRIVGHSFGGFTALNLAIRHPDLVECLVAEEPIFAPVLLSNPKNPVELLQLMFRNFEAGKSLFRIGVKGIDPAWQALARGDTRTAANAFINGITKGTRTPDTLDDLTKIQLRDNIEALEGEDPFKNSIRMEETAMIRCPVLLIDGTESPYIFRYINKTLEERIPNAQRVTIAKTGHWCHIDDTAQFAKIVMQFFDEWTN